MHALTHSMVSNLEMSIALIIRHCTYVLFTFLYLWTAGDQCLLHVLLETGTLSVDERRELMFDLHFKERMMGLLSALIPDVGKVLLTSRYSCS